MGDVVWGFVHDFGTGEEWTAERGRGAFLNGEPLGAVGPKDTIEILSFEGTTARAVAETIPALLELVGRVRVMGSLALTLCHMAAGRIDARLLAEARALGRHRGRAAPRSRVRARDRSLRGSAVRGRPARSRPALALRGGRHAGARGAACSGSERDLHYWRQTTYAQPPSGGSSGFAVALQTRKSTRFGYAGVEDLSHECADREVLGRQNERAVVGLHARNRCARRDARMRLDRHRVDLGLTAQDGGVGEPQGAVLDLPRRHCSRRQRGPGIGPGQVPGCRDTSDGSGRSGRPSGATWELALREVSRAEASDP